MSEKNKALIFNTFNESHFMDPIFKIQDFSLKETQYKEGGVKILIILLQTRSLSTFKSSVSPVTVANILIF